jgi:hypothetical protein
MKPLRLAVIALAAFASLASGAQRTAYRPTRLPHAGTADDVYTRAVRVVTDLGIGIDTQDRQAGVLVTEWQRVPEIDGYYDLRWRIVIDGGELVVVSQCRRFIEGSTLTAGAVLDCGDMQPGNRAADGRALAERIAGRSLAGGAP